MASDVMPWLWRDTKRVTHRLSLQLDKPSHVTRVCYRTWCGKTITVDDVNPQTVIYRAMPTCLRCTVAAPPP